MKKEFDVLIVAQDYLLTSAAYWIWSCWQEGFMDNNYKCQIISEEKLDDFDILEKNYLIILDIALVRLEKKNTFKILKKLAEQGSILISNIWYPYDALPDKRINNLQKMLKNNHIKFLFGEQEDNLSKKLNKIFQNKYKVIPNAVKNSTLQTAKNLPYDEKYDYQVVFIGAKLPHKNWFNKNIIPEVKNKYNCLIHGNGWKKRDYLIKLLNKISFITNINSIRKISEKITIRISELEETKIYRNSKVVLNFHERDIENSKPHRIVNQRLFKLAACGCFQIVDKDSIIDKYYDEDKVLQLPLNKKLWLEKIDELVNKKRFEIERKRESIINHTESNHTSKRRVIDLLDQIKNINKNSKK